MQVDRSLFQLVVAVYVCRRGATASGRGGEREEAAGETRASGEGKEGEGVGNPEAGGVLRVEGEAGQHRQRTHRISAQNKGGAGGVLCNNSSKKQLTQT